MLSKYKLSTLRGKQAVFVKVLNSGILRMSFEDKDRNELIRYRLDETKDNLSVVELSL